MPVSPIGMAEHSLQWQNDRLRLFTTITERKEQLKRDIYPSIRAAYRISQQDHHRQLGRREVLILVAPYHPVEKQGWVTTAETIVLVVIHHVAYVRGGGTSRPREHLECPTHLSTCQSRRSPTNRYCRVGSYHLAAFCTSCSASRPGKLSATK